MKRAKVDDNQARIVECLERWGCTVQSIASQGGGCPDLLIGFRGVTAIAEVKDGTKPKSKQQLTPDEKEWRRTWKGQYTILRNAADVDGLMMALIPQVAGMKNGKGEE